MSLRSLDNSKIGHSQCSLYNLKQHNSKYFDHPCFKRAWDIVIARVKVDFEALFDEICS